MPIYWNVVLYVFLLVDIGLYYFGILVIFVYIVFLALCPKVARKLSGSCPKVVRKLSGSCPKVARMLPECCLKVDRKWINNCPKVSRKWARDINTEMVTKIVPVRAVNLSTGPFCTECRCKRFCGDDVFSDWVQEIDCRVG